MAQSQFFRSFVRFLGSLTFLISLLALMLLALILPTVANQFNPDLGYDRTIGALRRDWYGAWWFNILMALLMVNLTVCTVIRTPWRFFWQWGFLITHSGILTLMIGAAVTFNAKIYGDLQAVEGGSYDYFTIEHENELVARTSDGQSGAFPIRSNPYHRSTDRKTFGIAKSPVKLTVEEFLPNVSPDPAYREDPQGTVSAAEVMFHFAEEEPKRMFLVPGRQETVGVLAISSMPMTEEEYADFIEPTGDKGRMTVTIGGETGVVDFATDKDKAVRVGGADVTLREWGAPKRENPNFWARFDLSRNGSAESWTINAFDHDHPLHRADGGHNDPGFTAHYAPRFTPEEIHGRGVRGAMYFCNLPGGVRWFALGSTGEKQHGPVPKGERVRYPFMPIPLEFEFVKWIERAKMVPLETEPKKNRPRNPAIRVTAAADGRRETRWLSLFGGKVEFDLGGRAVEAIYQGRQYRDLPFTVTLDDFRVTFNRGTFNSAKHFESDLTLQDNETGEITKQTIEVNTPMKYKGFVIYQASWNPEDRRMSIFQISRDPGKKILYLGWIMAVSGSIFMFFLKPFLQKLIKAGSKGQDRPLGSGGALAIFGLVTLGTIAGMIAPLVFRNIDALWLGLGIAGVDLLLALTVAVLAKAWMSSRPVRALQAGEILSAGWCLNTAALVILLMMKVTA